MIEHTVTFSLSHPAGSAKEADFLRAAAALSEIAGVRDFRIRRQVSDKHPHAFGITMNFATREDYDVYCRHPRHDEFVRERWLVEVSDFQEADFVDL
mgnify:FL=1